MAPESDLSDVALLDAARSGSRAAFSELWSRHTAAGIAYARSFASVASPEDLVAEAFSRIIAAVREGKGPTGAFRAYLMATIRNIALTWARRRQHEADHENLDLMPGDGSPEADAITALENSIMTRAFASLGPRWQEVLWYSEVERLTRSEIAGILGIKANAVSQLTFRAREALRGAWIQEHLQSEALDPEHREVVGLLGARARDSLSRRDRRRVDAHLAACPTCVALAEEADRVGGRFALGLLPLAAGAVVADHHVAALQAAALVPVAAATTWSAGVSTAAATAVLGAAISLGVTLPAWVGDTAADDRIEHASVVEQLRPLVPAPGSRTTPRVSPAPAMSPPAVVEKVVSSEVAADQGDRNPVPPDGEDGDTPTGPTPSDTALPPASGEEQSESALLEVTAAVPSVVSLVPAVTSMPAVAELLGDDPLAVTDLLVGDGALSIEVSLGGQVLDLLGPLR